MIDPILKKAMDRRDEALHDVEFWEAFIKGYAELYDPTVESLDIPMKRSAPLQIKQPDEATKAEQVVPSLVKQNGEVPLDTSVSAPVAPDSWNPLRPFRGKAKATTEDGSDSLPSFLASAKSK
jgi:hypothetical protein